MDSPQLPDTADVSEADSLTARRGYDVTGGLGLPLAIGLGVVAFVVASVVVVLLASGPWYIAIAPILAGPVFYVLNRYPFAAITIWVALAPFVMVGDGGGERKVYWIIHRAVPVAAIVVMVVARWVGVRKDKLPRLGWPEAMMGGYVVLTVISIAYRSLDPLATSFYMYDHVVIPMSLYLLVRLHAPDEKDFSRLVPVLFFFVCVQTLIGVLGWVSPESLPAGWLGREDRATGTLRHPNVYATTLLFAGLYLTHYAQTVMRDRPWARRALSLTLPVAATMAVVTLSRAAWLAALVVIVGIGFIYPHLSRRLLVVGAVAMAALLMGGMFGGTVDTLASRLNSESSALSRLPVMLASVRMIEEEPLIGWGYENFDRYDYQFAEAIEGVYVPTKDHASHNFFLTVAAEGGLLGFALYMGPAVWWLVKSRTGIRHLPAHGFRSKNLVGMMWLAMAAQLVAHNLSNNRVAFGLGVWWLALGFIATACDWRDRATEEAAADVRDRIAALTGAGQTGFSDRFDA